MSSVLVTAVEPAAQDRTGPVPELSSGVRDGSPTQKAGAEARERRSETSSYMSRKFKVSGSFTCPFTRSKLSIFSVRVTWVRVAVTGSYSGCSTPRSVRGQPGTRQRRRRDGRRSWTGRSALGHSGESRRVQRTGGSHRQIRGPAAPLSVSQRRG